LSLTDDRPKNLELGCQQYPILLGLTFNLKTLGVTAKPKSIIINNFIIQIKSMIFFQ
jgi:hypothetical protein